MLAFVSGLTSLAYQVLWTRLIASGTGNSTYVFSLILVVFLSGLALGALAFNLLRPRLQEVIPLLAVGQVAIAVLATLGVVVLAGSIVDKPMDLPTSIADLFGDFARTTVLIVLPTTFVMGLTFPAASALVAGRDDEIGSRTGLLLASNTLGAIIATFAIPFIVIPLVGSPVALGLVAIVNAVTGVAVALGGRIERPVPRVVTGTAGVVVAVGLVVAIVGGGLFIDPSIARIQKAGGVVYQSAEDEIASVQAGQLHGAKQLWVTGIVDDPADRRRQAHADHPAHLPAGLDDRADDRLRDGQRLPGGPHRRAQDRWGRARPVGPGRCSATSIRTPPRSSPIRTGT